MIKSKVCIAWLKHNRLLCKNSNPHIMLNRHLLAVSLLERTSINFGGKEDRRSLRSERLSHRESVWEKKKNSFEKTAIRKEPIRKATVEEDVNVDCNSR